jgi:hypothetical protein
MDNAIGKRVKRVIVPLPNILAGVEAITNLSNEDISRHHPLATKLLHAPPLGIGITPVATGTLTFLMSHHMPLGVKTP